MNQKYLFFIGLLSLAGRGFSQPNPTAYAKLITPESLYENLNIIASDALEGRYTASRGQKMAAAFIQAQFKMYGLSPPVSGSYKMSFPLYSLAPETSSSIEWKGKVYKNYQHVIYVGKARHETSMVDWVFGGQGTPEDIKTLDVKGKAVLLWMDNIINLFLNAQEISQPVTYLYKRGAAMVLLSGQMEQDVFSKAISWAQKNDSLKAKNLVPTIPQDSTGYFIIHPELAKSMLNKAPASGKQKKPRRQKTNTLLTYNIDRGIRTVYTENILGYIQGSDKQDEAIILTAHYDHIGMAQNRIDDYIYNGADDDGSGTVALLQLAKAFAQAKKEGNGPRRSLLFMAVTGEEIGLYGSDFYVNNPIIPLKKTMANLNMDMIGRYDSTHHEKTNYVYIIGSDKLSLDLHQINQQANKKYTQLELDYTYNSLTHPDQLYYRSDHWNFAKNQIPIIFYFDGIHKDYHQVTDEISRIDFPLLAKRAQLVFYTAWELANREDKLRINK